MAAFDWGNALKGVAATGGSGIGALGGFLGNNDYEKDTNNILNQIPGELRQYLMPYINAGKGAMGKATGEYDKLISDPNEIINRLGAGYKQSPGYEFRLNQGENAINNAAAAGGMVGTGQHQQQAGELAENLAGEDFYNFLNKVLGLYGTGLQGEQGITELGAGASGSLANSLANILKTQAQLKYQSGLNENQQNSDLFSSIGSIFSKGASMFA